MENEEFDRIIYVSHPFKDRLSNLRAIESIVLALRKEYPNYLFVSPSHTFSFEYTEMSHEEGLKYCFWMLSKCDECWVFGDWENSRGCRVEIEYCQEHHIPLRLRSAYDKVVEEAVGEVV